MALAQWISPRGKLIDVGTTHIDMVIKNPNKFGFTIDQIKKIHKKHKEKLGSEGDAREEIIVDIIKQGWIRTRRYDRQSYWSVSIKSLDNKTKGFLWQWSKQLLKKKIEKDKYMTVQIVSVGKGNVITKYDMNDISKDILVKESYDGSCELENANIEDLPDVVLKEFKEWDDGKLK